MNQKTPKISIWIKVIIWMNIILSIRFLITCIIQMFIEPILGIIELIIQIIGIISLLGILNAKKWGVVTWACYILTVSIFNYVISGSMICIIFPCISYVLMYLLLQIKRDGISAWAQIFRHREDNSIINKNSEQKLDDTNIEVVKALIDETTVKTNIPTDTIIERKPDLLVHEKETISTANSDVIVLPYRNSSDQQGSGQTNNFKSETHTHTTSFNTSKLIHEINIKIDKSIMGFVFLILIAIIVVVAVFKGVFNEKAENDATNVTNTTTESNEKEGFISRPESFETESERWDCNGCSYSNFDYGFSFKLPSDIAWHLIRGTAKHTVVKFFQPDTEITLFVNINELENKKVNDIWDIYDLYTIHVLPMAISRMQSIGETIKEHNYKKSSFCGHHAIKVRYLSSYQDDRFEKPLEVTSIDYTIIYKGVLLTVSLKAYSEVVSELSEEGLNIEDYLKCFILLP